MVVSGLNWLRYGRSVVDPKLTFTIEFVDAERIGESAFGPSGNHTLDRKNRIRNAFAISMKNAETKGTMMKAWWAAP